MKRVMNLSEIGPDKLFKSSDMLRIGCDGCSGKATCCRDTDDTILLDPYDMYELEKVTGLDFSALYGKYINLRVVDGIILPYLIKSEATGVCVFLGADGRCTIHNHRPGFCRLFPLGRIYHDDTFSYFMQADQCPCDKKPKTEIAKWLGIPNLKQYEAYILQWNKLLEASQNEALKLATSKDDSPEAQLKMKQLSMHILTRFYLPPYKTNEPFYNQFQNR